MKAFRKIINFTLIIGIVGIAFNYVFGANTVGYIKQIQVPNTDLVMYQYDFAAYIRNLTIVFQETPSIVLEIPTRTWQTLTMEAWADQLGNNLALILDYIIMINNVLNFPLRVGGYAVRIAISILGINLVDPPNTNINWLIVLIDTLRNLFIPYI